jgi:hypothetical protein
MADLSVLRGALGEVEFFILNNWTPFQRELFLFSRDTHDPSLETVDNTPARARQDQSSRGGKTFR